VLVVPSPKFQLKVYGEMPPEPDPVNVTSWADTGELGLYEKLATRVGIAET
jgi:hypothetical protein